MKITAIKKLKGGKYKLELETKEQIITYDSIILENNLLFSRDIDLGLLTKINDENNYYDIYNKVIKMVGSKLRSEKEIKEFLVKNNLSDKDIDRMIYNLKENNIINDIKFARAFIHDKINFTNYGPNKIKDELLKNNIQIDIIEKEMSNIDNEIFDEKINKIINKKINSNHKYSNNILKKKICEELFNLGFSEYNLDKFIFFNEENILRKESLKQYNKLKNKYDGKELKLKLYQKLYQKGFTRELIEEELIFLNISE